MTAGEEAAVVEIFARLRSSAASAYFGEPVSQLDHALQAARLAAEAGADDEEIIAALLHDIGHLIAPETAPRMGLSGVAHHEDFGADYLAALGFSKRVTDLVRGHVAAKRYLVFRNDRYREGLSPASRETLLHQGGPMTVAEASAFERDPLFEAKLRQRSFDERAKHPGMGVPSLETYHPLLVRHLQNRPS